MLQTTLSLSRNHIDGELPAAKVITEWSRWIQDKAALSYQSPSFFEVSMFSDEFKIVDMDAEN